MKLFIIALFLNINLFAIDQIIIAGTGSSQKLLKILGAEFEKDNPNTNIIIPNTIGSGGGIKNTALGKSDLGRVARDIKESEKKYKLDYLLFAYSPVVFVTNKSVQNLKSLTKRQLVDIYSGKIKKWEELGAKSGKIYVASREVGDSSRDIIDSNIKSFASIQNPVGEMLFSVPEMLNVMTKYENTIGYMSYSQAISTDLNIINIEGIEPSNENIQKGSYQLYGKLGIVYYKDKINSLSKRFLEFLQSPKAKKIINEQGAIAK